MLFKVQQDFFFFVSLAGIGEHVVEGGLDDKSYIFPIPNLF